VVIALTPKGRAQVDGLIPIAKKLEGLAVTGLPPKDLAVVKRTLKRMYGNLTNGRRKAR
jgi:DNA-binding MarR family transcriptional regulator